MRLARVRPFTATSTSRSQELASGSRRGPATTTDAPRVVNSQAARLPQKANKDFDLLVVPGGEHNAGRGGEFGPYGERKRFDFFVRQLLGVTPPSWNEAAPADRQPGSSELRTRSRLGHRARRAEPAQVGCGASKSLLNIRCSSIHRSLTCRRMKRNFPRSRRTSPPGGARLSR